MSFVALFLVSFAFTSCTKEEDVPTNSVEKSTGDYWPMTVGNQWNLTNGTDVSTVKISGTDVFGGITYYKLSNEVGGSDIGSLMGFDMQSWITKKGATYYNKIGDMYLSQDGLIMEMKGFEMPVLKDNLEVGGSWSGTVSTVFKISHQVETESIKMNVKYTGTILEKNVTEIVNEVTYPDVIKTKIKQEIILDDPSLADGETNVTETEYWYAKNVGQIKIITSVEGESSEMSLVDYIVKK